MANYTREISHMMDRMLTKVLAQDKKGFYKNDLIYKLSLLDLLIIKTIGENKEVTLKTLIKILELDRNLIDISLKNLIGLKLIHKSGGLSDKRGKTLNLATNGEKLYSDLQKSQLEEMEFILNDVTINEEKMILKFLSKIVQYHTDKFEI